MKRIYTIILTLTICLATQAQGWPAQYKGVMLQGFFWDSYDETNWTVLEKQADELSKYFSLVWLPQSGNCGGTSMGYDDLYWFPGGNNYNSSFGTETELRSLISTFKDKGIGTIADVVINHRKTLASWTDFPKETYNGTTYQLLSTDICANDDGGKTKEWATANGYSLSTNNDTGEGWDGMRDLDHNSENVQNNVKAYLKMLLEDLGYAGFRYDMVKGYSGSFTGNYNADAKPTYSVGEYWDGNATAVKNWLNATKVNDAIQSAAFDFPFRYTVRDAVNGNDWTKLSNASLISDDNYKRYAVTFVENHDTEKRSNANQDPILKDTLAANAFMLAMPGTPSVFLKHWLDCKQDIKAMIDVRNLAGISNESTYRQYISTQQYYSSIITGSNHELMVVVGDISQISPRNRTKILSGYHYAYYLPNSAEVAWADLASGEYTTAQQVTLTAVSADANAKLVYTTNGTTPTASSTQAVSGTTISLPLETTMTLKVGLLTDGQVKNVITREYVVRKPVEETFTMPSFCTRTADEICAFFEAPATWTGTIKCWAWTESPADNFTGGVWPGAECTQVGTTDSGKKVWKWTWDGKKANNTSVTQPTGIIFNNNGSPQTGDLTFVNGAYYRDKDGTNMGTVGITTGIAGLTTSETTGIVKVFTLDGRLLRTGKTRSEATNGLKSGLYIIDKQKVLIQ